MKRKGRKAQKKVEPENGVDESSVDQNGDASENEKEEPESKKRKSGKAPRKGAPQKKVESEPSETDDDSDSSKNKNDDDEGEYEVESVLDEKMIKGVRHFLIRWKGYEPESDTWEPASTLDCDALIADFKAKQKRNKNKPASKKLKQKPEDNKPDWNENDDFEVDRILEVHFKKNGTREFLVHWKGYSNNDNSWEPEENMDCKDLIERFMHKVEQAKNCDSRELRTQRPHTDRFTLSTKDTGRRLSRRFAGKQRIHYHDAE